ncbi:UDP-glucose/GDP-mannose dehydrogenase family protein [Rossellomorea vietnamensis]|uniref:UDP-glucose 6-dehydrogenase n=1 Tax=Rossellomorea vietnamensis TaxID=218284 RepID=A0A5D4K798_9BACI|nr:UDP-glucose/GDP-mannose dehydrogenase family protein [Rossellomorea vietnamensis]TYR72635.1 UDP-glucose/GDP-mannose dehydrogenase family protein [Rossellomorea vietnamensis]
MRVTVIGTGYVGLVTGVCLAEIGHEVVCLDIDEKKITALQQGFSSIYEPGLEEVMQRNQMENRLSFTGDYTVGCKEAEVIIIAVGTPSNPDGSANLSFIKDAAENIAVNMKRNHTIIVTKSTVPVGTNQRIKQWIAGRLPLSLDFEIASNPEFLREGSAIEDTFQTDRIIIGTDSEVAAKKLMNLYEPINAPVLLTSIQSAEMIKYASNAFLATKISFINEIANLCEKLGADIGEVAAGMGMDKRIGPLFLQAGIGYGGSCFPKDTSALVQISGEVEHRFDLLESVINVNSRQQVKLVQKALAHFGSIKNKKAAVLGLSFKPNTDDIREAASLEVIEKLLQQQVDIVVYDPVAIQSVRSIFGDRISYASSVEEAVRKKDMAFIITEWEEIKTSQLENLVREMNDPVIFDGRNCFDLRETEKVKMDYISIGRRPVLNRSAKIPII